jgi:hypothetical protein
MMYIQLPYDKDHDEHLYVHHGLYHMVIVCTSSSLSYGNCMYIIVFIIWQLYVHHGLYHMAIVWIKTMMYIQLPYDKDHDVHTITI